MIKWLTSRIRQIVGRVDMARLLRDFVLVVFSIFAATVIPALPELSKLNTNSRLWIIVLIIVVAVPYLLIIYSLGKVEEGQQKKRDKELVTEILKGLGYGGDADSEYINSTNQKIRDGLRRIREIR